MVKSPKDAEDKSSVGYWVLGVGYVVLSICTSMVVEGTNGAFLGFLQCFILQAFYPLARRERNFILTRMGKRGRPPKDDVPWEDIKNAYMLGEPCGVICERYPGLKPGTLRSRASREGWTTPRNIKQKLAERVNAVKVAELTGELSSTQAKGQLNQLDAVVETLAERQAEHRETIARITEKKFSKHKLPPIKTWRDADIADKMARRALEMDSDTPDAVINVGVLGGGAIVDEYSPPPEVSPAGIPGDAVHHIAEASEQEDHSTNND